MESFEANSEGSHYLSKVGTTKASTPLNPAVLEFLSASDKKNVVDIPGYITCITIPCPVVRARTL